MPVQDRRTSTFDRIANAGGAIILATPDDMRSLHVENFIETPCPWASWAAAWVPVRAEDDTLPIIQDPQALITRDPAAIAAMLRGKLVLTFCPDNASQVLWAAGEVLDLREHLPNEFQRTSILHAAIDWMRSSPFAPPNTPESLDPRAILRMIGVLASRLVVERHNRFFSFDVSDPANLHVAEPAARAVCFELEERGEQIIVRTWTSDDGRPRLKEIDKSALSGGRGQWTRLATDLAKTFDAKDGSVLMLPAPGHQTGRNLHHHRPSAAARIALAGLKPAWCGVNVIATAVNAAHGLVSLELHRNGTLTALGWLPTSLLAASGQFPYAPFLYRPMLRSQSINAGRLLDWDALREKPLEEIRDLMRHAFVTEINPRLPLPYRLASSVDCTSSEDLPSWREVEAIVQDAAQADPDLAPHLPCNWTVLLPEDPTIGQPILHRASMMFEGKPPRAALLRLQAIAQAALIRCRGWGRRQSTFNGDGSDLSMLVGGTPSAPATVVGVVCEADSAHAQFDAHQRTAEFWREARTTMPIDTWVRRAPDGLPIPASTIAELDRRYL